MDWIQRAKSGGYPMAKKPVIVAITSYAMPGDRQRAIEAGCNDYMEKPIEPEVVISRLKKYLL
jgi:two-component system cell cycle response regulator DivK